LVGSTLRIRSAITVKLLSMKLSLRWERGTGVAQSFLPPILADLPSLR